MRREHLGARAAHRNEAGFTLLELMMVVLIIAILIAVLLPVLAGASTRAKDRATQGSLHDALLAAKTVYTDKADYTLADPTALLAATGAGSLTYVNSATSPTTVHDISVDPVSVSYIVMGAHSNSGSCFYVADDASGGGTMYARLGGAGGCSASGAPLPGDPAWKSAW